MGQYTSYYLYQKFEKRDGQDFIPVYPNTYSVDADGTMPRVVKNENDENCGYIPPTPTEIYRWVQITPTSDPSTYVCDECPIEPIYRWVQITPTQDSSTYVCDECPITELKFTANYSDSTSYSAECDSSTELTTATTKAHSTSYSAMTSAVIGDCVTSIGNSAFTQCISLSSVNIGNSVTNIGNYAFRYCTSLSSVTIPNSVTSIGNGVFMNCTSLSSVTVEATTPPTLGSNVFQYTNNCPIYVPCESVDDYKSAWSSYASRIQGIPPCEEPNYKLTANYSDSTSYSVECDSSTELTTATVRAHSTPYSAMTDAVIGDCVTSIGVGAFANCTSLSSVTIGSGVTSIGMSAFYGCTSLTEVIIGNSVTSIGQGAFQSCTSLTSVTIPNSVTRIGIWAFQYCSSLSSVTVEATTPPTLLNYNAFQYTSDNLVIYVPSGSVDAYKAAENWSTYASRIQGI